MIVQTYVGAVSVNTKQAKSIAGAAHSKCPLFRSFEVSTFSVVEISETEFSKEKYRQNNVDNREYNVIYNCFNLCRSGFPCTLNCARDIAAVRKGGYGHYGHCGNHKDRHKNNLCGFLLHKKIILSQCDGLTCQSSKTLPLMVRLLVRFAESIPAGVQQSIAHVYTL